MLTFRLLEVYRQVVDSGSITAASNTLSLSQPTVSLQLKKLSAEVGSQLIESQHGRLYMTEAGKAVYQCAQEIAAAQHKLNAQVEAIKGIEKGRLSIVVVTTAKYVIPPVLAEFCKLHEGLDILFQVRNRAQVIERLENNQDDIYIFSHPPEGDTYHKQEFMSNRLQVIAPNSYDGPDHCTLNDLKDKRFLMREVGSGTRMTIEQYCQQNQLTLTNTMLVESNEAIKLSVKSGLGLAILSEHTLAQGGDQGIKALEIEDFPIHSHWYAVTAIDRPKNLACEAFLSFLESYNDHEVS
ncbi:MAG: LysR family transcriptional regulator [Aliiglaciecola sp.]